MRCGVGLDCDSPSNEPRETVPRYVALEVVTAATGAVYKCTSPGAVFKCPDEDATSCPGGLPDQCGEHMSGIVCAECESEYVVANGVGTKCKDIETSKFFFPVLPAILGLIIIVVLYCEQG